MNHARRQGRTMKEDVIHLNVTVVTVIVAINIALACEQAIMRCGTSKANCYENRKFSPACLTRKLVSRGLIFARVP